MLLELLIEQRLFSLKAFGPRPRLAGVHDHLSKELQELKADPQDLSEWADCLLLCFDGAMRAGATPEELSEYLDIGDMRSPYRGLWHELRRDLGHMKTCRQLNEWRAWGIMAFKFLVSATRNGLTVDEVLQAARDKLEINKKRDWPDWRTIPEDKAIEHKNPWLV